MQTSTHGKDVAEENGAGPPAHVMPTPFRLGREEWLALPDLGLAALKAKVDTGAATSALHAFAIEIPDRPVARARAKHSHDERPMVRFRVNPVPNRNDIVVSCEAPLLGRRWVTSSNGERELRPVIRTLVTLGGRSWSIDLTLTNRGGMRYRMLLGQQALAPDMVVLPRLQAQQSPLSYEIYGGALDHDGDQGRRLRIALLIAQARPGASVRARGQDHAVGEWASFIKVAASRGHEVVLIGIEECAVILNAGQPFVTVRGSAATAFDLVIPAWGRATSGLANAGLRRAAWAKPYALSVLRQFERDATIALNGADQLEIVANPYRLHQVLAQKGIRTVAAQLSSDGIDGASLEGVSVEGVSKVHSGSGARAQPTADGNSAPDIIAALAIGGRAVAARKRVNRSIEPGDQPIERNPSMETNPFTVALTRDENRLIGMVARVLHLGVAQIEFERTPNGGIIRTVTPFPAWPDFAGYSAIASEKRLITHIERRALSFHHRIK